MNPHFQALGVLVPIIAALLGAVIYFGVKEGKNATVGLCLMFSGIFILLWMLTFGVVR